MCDVIVGERVEMCDSISRAPLSHLAALDPVLGVIGPSWVPGAGLHRANNPPHHCHRDVKLS